MRLLLLLTLAALAQPEPLRNAKAEFEKRKAGARTAETKYDLAMWAWDQKLKRDYREILEAAIKQEPDHRACRWALGHHKHKGKWLTTREAEKKKLVLCRGEWMNQEAYAKEKKAAEEVLAKRTPSDGKPGRAGSFVKDAQVRSKTRQYRLIVPGRYKPGMPMPLLLWLHGDGGRKDSYNRYFTSVIEKMGFIFVSPESRRWQVWAEGAEGSSYKSAVTEDDEYVMLCVRQTLKDYNVDMRRIYCAGQSKGATYSTKLVREQGEFFAAGGLINGVITSSYGRPSFTQGAFFVWFGSKDYLHPRYGLRKHILEKEGHKVKLVYREGAPHGATQDSVDELMEFLLKQSLPEVKRD